MVEEGLGTDCPGYIVSENGTLPGAPQMLWARMFFCCSVVFGFGGHVFSNVTPYVFSYY